MKNLILATILGVSAISTSNAFAASYKCSVAANEDYAVEVNMDTDQAAFFDNNEWSILQGSTGLGVATFAGQDVYGDKLVIQIDFTDGMVQHHRIQYSTNGRQVTSEMDCRFAKAEDLNSGI